MDTRQWRRSRYVGRCRTPSTFILLASVFFLFVLLSLLLLLLLLLVLVVTAVSILICICGYGQNRQGMHNCNALSMDTS